jgi:hypothetical protein
MVEDLRRGHNIGKLAASDSTILGSSEIWSEQDIPDEPWVLTNLWRPHDNVSVSLRSIREGAWLPTDPYRVGKNLLIWELDGQDLYNALGWNCTP